MSELSDRYDAIRAKIPADVNLVSVSKTRSEDEIQAVYDLGQRHFGENKAQELKDKAPILPSDIVWHFIGHLQTNKVKQVVPHADLIHAVDSMRLLDEINTRAKALDKVQRVLLQVHIAEESAKFGLVEGALEDIIEASLAEHTHIQICGLMGMATFTEDNNLIIREFNSLKTRFDEIQSSMSDSLPEFKELSMGMSGDMDLAIAAGSTLVRIGTAIFGKRAYF